MTRSLAPRSLSSSSAGSRSRRPVQRTKAQSRSTVLADSISVLSSAARFGSSLLLVSRAESLSLVVGRRRLRRLRVSGRWRDWSWVGPGAMRSAVFSSWRSLFARATRSVGLAAARARRTASATWRERMSGAVFVFYVREDWLQFCSWLSMVAECIRVEKFVQALGQLLRCHSPNEISHCARVFVLRADKDHRDTANCHASASCPEVTSVAAPQNSGGAFDSRSASSCGPDLFDVPLLLASLFTMDPISGRQGRQKTLLSPRKSRSRRKYLRTTYRHAESCTPHWRNAGGLESQRGV